MFWGLAGRLKKTPKNTPYVLGFSRKIEENYRLPTTHYLLPTTNYPLPTTHYQLPTIQHLSASRIFHFHRFAVNTHGAEFHRHAQQHGDFIGKQ